ncbi:MAG: bifunctional diguanylate cyclase/phosphodiesterase [Deltaproteobacteria bacterium]|nr:MAG: bifunctional diguanylate cyclase/phosphodiesterase [Deltaproteobacteria bacterium]
MNVNDTDPTALLLRIPASFEPRLRDALARIGLLPQAAANGALQKAACRTSIALALVGAESQAEVAPLLQRLPTTAVVVVGEAPSPETATAWMQLGARDWLTPDLSAADLTERLSATLLRTAPLRELAGNQAPLEMQASRDPMTGLLNHAHFQEAIETEVVRGRRAGSPAALALLDIDGFSTFNDREGHTAGNRLLLDLADLIRSVACGWDGPTRIGRPGITARYGPDQFGLLLPGLDKEGARRLCERLNRRVGEEASLLGHTTVSIGVAAVPEDGMTRKDLVDGATLALRASKLGGGNRITLYGPELRHLALSDTPEELIGLQALEETLESGRIGFAFQPIVEATGWLAVGYEALCRPQHGEIPTPGVLFGLAERAGRIHDLGRLIRTRVAERLSELPEGALLFVNLHPQELYDPGLLGQVAAFEGSPGRVVFEITESEAITDLPHTRKVIRALKRRGFRIALDDFGAGYAGLAHLDGLVPDYVKLDMGLVRRAAKSSRSRRLVRHIVDFCRAEGIEVIAEGIESPQELETVTALHCTLLQGFLLARPADPLPSLGPRP